MKRRKLLNLSLAALMPLPICAASSSVSPFLRENWLFNIDDAKRVAKIFNKSLEEVVDRITLFEVKYPVSAQGLLGGLMRAGKELQYSFLGLDSGLAILVGLKEYTGRELSVLGNSLRSILVSLRSGTNISIYQQNAFTAFLKLGKTDRANEILRSIHSLEKITWTN